MPDFLIIGATKSGTMSLYRMIASHPQVMPAKSKECAFFNRDLYARPLGGLWYRSHFPNVLHRHRLSRLHGRKILTGEATPNYLFSPHAPGRVKATLPDARLIVTLRNPVDRAYSAYCMHIRNNLESLTFEDAISVEVEGNGYGQTVPGTTPGNRAGGVSQYEQRPLCGASCTLVRAL